MTDGLTQYPYASMSAGFEDGHKIANNLQQAAEECAAGHRSMHSSGAYNGAAADAQLQVGLQSCQQISDHATTLTSYHHKGGEQMVNMQQTDAQCANNLLS
jgi:hypothetical protein